MKKIAVYGGSFDPPHKGHRLLAENLAKACDAQKVIVIPAALSPFKSSSSASAQERLEMCKLLFNDSLFDVSDIEISRGGKSYTVETLRMIKEMHPDSRLYLFMGDDMFLSFNRWYKYKEICELATIVCACRSGKAGLLDEMRSFAEREIGLSGNEIIICEAEPIEISSTELRGADDEMKKRYLDAKVFDYIKKRGLYE